GGDAGDLVLAQPRCCAEVETGGVAGRVGPPRAGGPDHGHGARAHEDDVAPLGRDALLLAAAGQVFTADGVARVQPVDTLVLGDVEEDATGHELVGVVLDAVDVGALAADPLLLVAVVHVAVVEDVGQRIPLGARLERHVHGVVRVAQAGQVVLVAVGGVAAVLQHHVDGVHPPEAAVLGAELVVRQGAGDDLARLDEGGRVRAALGVDVVDRAQLVVRAPAPPVAIPVGDLEHLLDRHIARGSVRHVTRLSSDPLRGPLTVPPGALRWPPLTVSSPPSALWQPFPISTSPAASWPLPAPGAASAAPSPWTWPGPAPWWRRAAARRPNWTIWPRRSPASAEGARPRWPTCRPWPVRKHSWPSQWRRTGESTASSTTPASTR